ncbi:MAG: hypothetical protein KDD66_08000 [Bdellovibrionales bacterium]|nr:hypothetical protein [Bdellovibrionales bacterium]
MKLTVLDKLIIFVLAAYPFNSLAQEVNNDVFDRARSVVDVVKTTRPESEQALTRKHSMEREEHVDRNSFGFGHVEAKENSRSAPKEIIQRPARYSLALKPVRSKTLPKLGACRKSVKRIERSSTVPKVFHDADYIFYSTDSSEQKSLAQSHETEAVKYTALDTLHSSNELDLRIELARDVHLRCLPTRVTINASEQGAFVRYAEGDIAWEETKERFISNKRAR